MAWFFKDSGDTRKRRRMGEVAKTDWREKWQTFFSGRKSRRSTPVDPPRSRPKKPAAITAYDEQAAVTLRGRSLPRWQRTARVVVWKKSRPLRRFHRRIPAAFLVLIYLGLLAGISCGLMMALLPGSSDGPAAPAQSPTATTSGNLVFQAPTLLSPASGTQAAPGLTGSASKPFSLTADIRDLKEQMADIEFRAGRYVEAERLYRALFKTSTNKPFFGYRIYVCALLRDQHGQAADLQERLVRIGHKTPAWHYARATQAYQEGRADDAEEILRSARTLYGDLCADYDPTLRTLGHLPPPPVTP